MNLQWMGSILIIFGCGSVGFLMALQEKREMHAMRQFMKALVYMDSELEYHLTPLPELFQRAAGQVSGPVGTLFQTMARELADQVLPNAAYCMEASLGKVPELPKRTAEAARELGSALGCFDLEGQQKGIAAVQDLCKSHYTALEENRPQRLRSYQTLGLCAGAALVILLL